MEKVAGDMGKQSLGKARLKRKQVEEEAAKVNNVVRNEPNVATSSFQKRKSGNSVDRAMKKLEVTRVGVMTAEEEVRTAEKELRMAARETTDTNAELGKLANAYRKLDKAFQVDQYIPDQYVPDQYCHLVPIEDGHKENVHLSWVAED